MYSQLQYPMTLAVRKLEKSLKRSLSVEMPFRQSVETNPRRVFPPEMFSFSSSKSEYQGQTGAAVSTGKIKRGRGNLG